MTLRKRQLIMIIYISFFVVLCFCGFHMTKDNIYNPTLSAQNIVLDVEDVEVIDKGSEIYYLTIEEINENYNTLLFYTNHQEVFVYSEEKLIYSLECSSSVFAGTTGAKWNMIALPADTKQLEVTFKRKIAIG